MKIPNANANHNWDSDNDAFGRLEGLWWFFHCKFNLGCGSLYVWVFYFLDLKRMKVVLCLVIGCATKVFWGKALVFVKFLNLVGKMGCWLWCLWDGFRRIDGIDIDCCLSIPRTGSYNQNHFFANPNSKK